MIKKGIIISLATLTFANTDRSFDGYSYFAVGVENFKYSEKFIYTFNSAYVSNSGKSYLKGESVAVKSKINVSSPVYLSGSLIRLNKAWDLSMDFASTSKPKITKEKWIDRGDGSTITTNYATIMSNSMRFLMQYKLTNMHRLTFGFNYILNNFKRFNDPDAQTTQLIEETTSTLVLDAGYWFESSTADIKNNLRIKYSITAGLPIYENVTNTAAPNLEFSNKKGFNLDTSLYAGYGVMQGVEVGAFINYSYMYREGEEKNYKNKKVIWPTNITQSLRAGLNINWHFK